MFKVRQRTRKQFSARRTRRFLAETLESRSLFNALDPAFGAAGIVLGDLGTSATDKAFDIAVQSDGRAVAVGSSGSDFGIVRYNADGSLDDTFGTGGIVKVDFGGTDAAHGVTFLPDGRMVVVGETAGDFALCSLNPDGTLDTTFSGDGLQTKDLGGSDALWGTVYDPVTDRIFAVGNGDASNYSVVARYKLDGTLDTSWDGDGLKYQSFGSNEALYALQLDGKIVIAGKVGNDFIVVRYNTNGSSDTGFDGDGRQIVNIGTPGNTGTTTTDAAYGLAIKGSGSSEKILLSGTTGTGTSTSVALVQINGSNGSIDSGFGSSGRVITSMGTNSSAVAYDVNYLPTGQIIAVGSANGDAFVNRYTSAGALDTTWNGSGIDAVDLGSSTDEYRAVTLDATGNALVAGSSGNDFALARHYVAPLAAATSVTATALDDSATEIDWTDPNLGELSWTIERADNASFTGAVALGSPSTSSSASCIDETAGDGIFHYYRLTATNPGNSSSVSTAVAALARPAATGNLVLNLSESSASTVALSWSAPSITDAGVVDLQRASDANFTSNVTSLTVPEGATSISDTPPATGGWFYRARRTATGTNGLNSQTATSSSDYATGSITTYASFQDMPILSGRPSSFIPKITIVGQNMNSLSGDFVMSEDAPPGTLGSHPNNSAKYLTVRSGNSVHFSAAGVQGDMQGWFLDNDKKHYEGINLVTDTKWEIIRVSDGVTIALYNGFSSAHTFDATGDYILRLRIKNGGEYGESSQYVRVVANDRDTTGRQIYVDNAAVYTPTELPTRGTSSTLPIKWGDINTLLTAKTWTADFQIRFKKGVNSSKVYALAGGSGFKNVDLGSGSTAFSNVYIGVYGSGSYLPILDIPAGGTQANSASTPFAFRSGNKFIDIHDIIIRGALNRGKTENSKGTALQARGKSISMDNCTWLNVAYGANQNELGVVQGLLITNSGSSGSGTGMTQLATYALWASATSSNITARGDRFGSTYSKDHNTRTYASRMNISDCQLNNYYAVSTNKSDQNNQNGYHTLRVHDGEYVYWGGNDITGGQVNIGNYTVHNDVTGKDDTKYAVSLKYIVMERNTVAADPHEDTASNRQDGPRLEVSHFGGARYVAVRNNVFDTGATGGATGQ